MLATFLRIFTTIAFLIFTLPLQVFACDANLPCGSTVVTGDVTTSQTGSTLNVNVTSSGVSKVDWDSFNVGKDYSVIFNQANKGDTILNEIPHGGASTIDGNIFANGNVWILNPNGVLFGANANINVAGLLAGAGSISSTDDNRIWKFQATQGKSVSNQGHITINQPNSYAALLGFNVNNSGTIISDLGSTQLASANNITVTLPIELNSDGSLNTDPSSNSISLILDTSAKPLFIQSSMSNKATASYGGVNNSGTIQANGGQIGLSAYLDNSSGVSAVNTSGVLMANSVNGSGGVISLTSKAGGGVDISGNITAKDNYKINTQGAVNIHDGSITITGDKLGADLFVTSNTSINISNEKILVEALVDNARIDLQADGSDGVGLSEPTITINQSTLTAATKDPLGGALISLEADGNIVSNASMYTALGNVQVVGGEGIKIDSSGEGVTLSNNKFNAIGLNIDVLGHTIAIINSTLKASSIAGNQDYPAIDIQSLLGTSISGSNITVSSYNNNLPSKISIDSEFTSFSTKGASLYSHTTISNSTITDTGKTADIELGGQNGLTMDQSTATATGTGASQINLNSNFNINLSNSTLTSKSLNDASSINLDSAYNNIVVSNSTLNSNGKTSQIVLSALNSLILNQATLSNIGDGGIGLNGADILLSMKSHLSLDNSATGTDGNYFTATATDDLTISDGTTIDLDGTSQSKVTFSANNDVNLNDFTLDQHGKETSAFIHAIQGDINLEKTNINLYGTNGAFLGLAADVQNIYEDTTNLTTNGAFISQLSLNGNDVNLLNSNNTALNIDKARSSVSINANHEANLTNSTLIATSSDNDSNATIAANGDYKIQSSSVLATSNNQDDYGSSFININGANGTINNSNVRSKSTNQGSSATYVKSSGLLGLSGSTIAAGADQGDVTAQVNVDDTINSFSSSVNATTNQGAANSIITSNGSFNLGDSSVQSTSGNGSATSSLTGNGGSSFWGSGVSSTSTNGDANATASDSFNLSVGNSGVQALATSGNAAANVGFVDGGGLSINATSEGQGNATINVSGNNLDSSDFTAQADTGDANIDPVGSEQYFNGNLSNVRATAISQVGNVNSFLYGTAISNVIAKAVTQTGTEGITDSSPHSAYAGLVALTSIADSQAVAQAAIGNVQANVGAQYINKAGASALTVTGNAVSEVLSQHPAGTIGNSSATAQTTTGNATADLNNMSSNEGSGTGNSSATAQTTTGVAYAWVQGNVTMDGTSANAQSQYGLAKALLDAPMLGSNSQANASTMIGDAQATTSLGNGTVALQANANTTQGWETTEQYMVYPTYSDVKKTQCMGCDKGGPESNAITPNSMMTNQVLSSALATQSAILGIDLPLPTKETTIENLE